MDVESQPALHEDIIGFPHHTVEMFSTKTSLDFLFSYAMRFIFGSATCPCNPMKWRHAYRQGWHRHATIWCSVLTFHVISLGTVFDFFIQVFSILSYIIRAPDLTFIGLGKNTLQRILFTENWLWIAANKILFIYKALGVSPVSEVDDAYKSLCFMFVSHEYWPHGTSILRYVYQGPFYCHGITNIHYEVWVKLLIHSQNSNLKQLKFGKG